MWYSKNKICWFKTFWTIHYEIKYDFLSDIPWRTVEVGCSSIVNKTNPSLKFRLLTLLIHASILVVF